jgi:hypothetical protein
MDARDKNRLMEWISGQILVPSLKLVVMGDRGKTEAKIEAIACLYPIQPKFRTLNVNAEISERELRAAVLACTLPRDAEDRHRQYVREQVPGFGVDDQLWRTGVTYSIRHGLPLGFYTLGRTVKDGQPRAVLQINALLSPTRFMAEFMQQARN